MRVSNREPSSNNWEKSDRRSSCDRTQWVRTRLAGSNVTRFSVPNFLPMRSHNVQVNGFSARIADSILVRNEAISCVRLSVGDKEEDDDSRAAGGGGGGGRQSMQKHTPLSGLSTTVQ
jgi:hypothetical protein